MSLLKLLTTGKSLVGLKDAESRYRMTNQRLLPKFGSGKNPFRDAEATGFIAKEAAPGVVEKISAPASVAPAVAASSPAPAPRAPISSQGAGLLRLGASKARDLAATVQNRWVSQLGSVLSRPARKPMKPAVVPLGPTVPVQGELSLDRIKVMRNDLSDADLEVVPARPARPAPAPAVREQEPAEPAEKARGPVSAPMFNTVNR